MMIIKTVCIRGKALLMIPCAITVVAGDFFEDVVLLLDLEDVIFDLFRVVDAIPDDDAHEDEDGASLTRDDDVKCICLLRRT
jgi:hypothetical protein